MRSEVPAYSGLTLASIGSSCPYPVRTDSYCLPETPPVLSRGSSSLYLSECTPATLFALAVHPNRGAAQRARSRHAVSFLETVTEAHRGLAHTGSQHPSPQPIRLRAQHRRLRCRTRITAFQLVVAPSRRHTLRHGGFNPASLRLHPSHRRPERDSQQLLFHLRVGRRRRNRRCICR